MGTNYYWVKKANPCDACGRADVERWHIGKSSEGWVFALNTHPEGLGVCGLEHWIVMWVQQFVGYTHHIEDEDGIVVSIEEMLRVILFRYEPYQGLRRFSSDDPGFIRHAIGTYDIMCGEFF